MTDTSPRPAQPASPPPPAAPSAETEGPWKPARAGWRWIALCAVLIVVGVLAVLAAWRLPPFTSAVERTEDAYVYGHTTVISPEVSGYVWKVPVEDFQTVRAGQVLVAIDPRTYQQQLTQAQAQLATSRTNLSNNAQNLSWGDADVASKTAAVLSAQAEVRRAAVELRHTRDLVRDGSVSARENDANIAALTRAQGSLKEAEAAERAALEPGTTEDRLANIYAPMLII